MKTISTAVNFGTKKIASAAWLLLLISTTGVYQGCNDDDAVIVDNTEVVVSPKTVLLWNAQIQKAYTFAPGEGFPPPIIARWFAMYHVAMHDALNSIDPRYYTYTRHDWVETENQKADPDAAVTQAVYRVLSAIGPQEGPAKSSFDSLYQVIMASIPEGESKRLGITLGNDIGVEVLSFRSEDGPFLQVVGYDPTPDSGVEPGVYKYLPPLNYALAGYHLMKPWTLTSGDQFLVEAPYPINSDEYLYDYDEVMKLGEMNSTERTEDQRALGIFWAENTSRGWNAVATEVLKNSGMQIGAWGVARMLALLHVSIADAYISVFDSKVHYNYWRPITAIHEGDHDGNPDTQGNPNWEATMPTPPIAEYPSAHALTGAAAGQVLIRFFGKSGIPFSIDSGYFPGIRSFETIDEAILENSLSRIYIGYHFRNAVQVGELAGKRLGDFVFENSVFSAVPSN